MIKLKVSSNGAIYPNRGINVGMKYDNTNEQILFVLPEALETYNKYVVYSNSKGTFLAPLSDNTWTIRSNITNYPGTVKCLFLLSETELDPNNFEINNVATFLKVSGEFQINVANHFLKPESVQPEEESPEIQLLFNNMMTLYHFFEEAKENDYYRGPQGPSIIAVPITWESLKSLRDNSLLRPGQQYRITNYTTTTTQADTQSAGHVFDIIVTADDVDKLNENARAVRSESDTILKGITASIATTLGEVGDVLKRAFFVDSTDFTPAGFDYAWGTNADISDGDRTGFVYTQSDTPSAGDAIWYDGDYGAVVSRVEEDYFANSKLEAWKLKYCLDNDTDRFIWALDKTIKVIKCYETVGDVYIHIRCPEEDVDGKFAWAFTSVDSYRDLDSFSVTELLEDVDRTDLGFTSTEEIIPGETIFEYQGYSSPVIDYIEMTGKGVIYRMIDEFNNDCPYDFKNIQFKRKLTDGELDLDSGIDTWVYTFTMSDLIEDKVVDISLKQNTEYPDDELQYRQCANNSVKEAILDYQLDGLIRIKLNDNVFLNIFDNNESHNYYGCYGNTFGHNCYGNTFGHNCSSNTFGDSCSSNTFGTYCSRNTFGNGCYNNTFGNNCYSNTFGDDCSSNTFGDDCSYNTFGGNCSQNTFGDGCYSNTFSNYCSYNSFSNNCSYNTFGNICQYLQISDSSATQKRYISVDDGIRGASSANKFDLYDSAILNKDYQVTFKKSASGKYLMLWATDAGTMTGKVKDSNIDTTWEDIV